MKVPNRVLLACFVSFLALRGGPAPCRGQDYDVDPAPAVPTRGQDECNGIYLSYNFGSREKEYPHVKNASAQSWAFKSTATLLNTGLEELKAWKIFVGFQHEELLVSANGAVLMGGDDFPAKVGNNGTYLAGYPQADLKTAVETAEDINQMQVRIEFLGTQFGVSAGGTPMPKTIKLVNDGYKCPTPRIHGTNFMYTCCVKDKKFKAKPTKNMFLPRQYGDLSITYDVLQAYQNNYLAQVTIDNSNPLGRLDHWNLTWEWMRGEFISSMRGAYVHVKDDGQCIYSPIARYYADFDFSQVVTCAKKPVIADLPAERANDTKVGKIPYCCRNGTILPKLMDPSKSMSIFQMQVFKLPPDLNRTALSPPQNWKIHGVLNADYKCGPPIRVDPTEFPDTSGLQAITLAIATWQVTCNITRPKIKQSKCCVSFSAYYNDSVVPCNPCACGCPEEKKCNHNARQMLLPPEALLVPFDNRTLMTKAWAHIKHFPVPTPLPCPDNCGVSINWHINSDFKGGWTARVTLFNWGDFPFEDWSAAVQIKKAFAGYEKAYSFNGTALPEVNNTIFIQGLKGLNYLMGETNGTHPKDPRNPGKQQSVISFTKKQTPHINIQKGDGFPTKFYFNGEECALPSFIQHQAPAGNPTRAS
ncbi:hypothetical protein MLD38_034223 [Melastoma candidum]|uniref:Uncharacterized protein n=1 Tax=Melastoma candidum TaxID=119954 RepID=A0ACB9M9W5_9MYRT|nr:hypothetical protein MLD38_034223 [Melastoma candidum]